MVSGRDGTHSPLSLRGLRNVREVDEVMVRTTRFG